MAISAAVPPDSTAASSVGAARRRRLVDEALLALVEDLPPRLRCVCGEALGVTDLEGRRRDGGGKRLRPVLCLTVAEALRGDTATALPAALALECVHAFSLVHDDIVDGDRERRGRPSLWAAVGSRLALNAGDALQALSSSLACQAGPAAAPLIHCAVLAMIDGQHLDIASEGVAEPTLAGWEELASRKTGALFAAAAAAGAAVAGAGEEVEERCWQLGELLGLAFQARDDILGVWGDPRRTGKPAASDLARRTLGLPVACGVEAGGARAAALRRGLRNPRTPNEALLELLAACGARARAEMVEAGYAARLVMLGADGLLAPAAWEAFDRFAGGLRGREA